MSSKSDQFEYESESDYESETDSQISLTKDPRMLLQAQIFDEAEKGSKKKIVKRADNINEEIPVDTPQAVEVAAEPPKKVKKPMKEGDKRKTSSAKNLERARATRMANIAAQKAAAAQVCEVETSSSEEDEETELVLKKKKKPMIVSRKDEIEKLKLEIEKGKLEKEKLEMQLKSKRRSRTVVVERETKPKKETSVHTEALKKKFLI